MGKKDITSCRGCLEFLKEQGELLVIEKEVDPIFEIAALTKALDNGPALVFEKVKGYPEHRVVSNLLSRLERMAKLFDVPEPREVKFAFTRAIKEPVPPKMVDSGPCQEVVITKDIDVLGRLPVIQQTPKDAGRILSGGNVLISGEAIGHCVTYKRMHFRGDDWASMAFNPGSHFEHWVLERRKEGKNLPLTINISPSPAVQFVAGAGSLQIGLPTGSDELGIAGGMQGAPVELCRAVTVDAYAIANSEYVIEGYIDTGQVVWENSEAEKEPKLPALFFPEAMGYMGRARSTYKFQATAITHRQQSPIFYAPLATTFEAIYVQTLPVHAVLYELLNRQWPGLVTDVNSLPGMKVSGAIIQVNVRRRRDEEHIKSLILAALAACNILQTVLVVDQDIDIYNADEVVWALTTRLNPKEDVILVPSGGKSSNLRRGLTTPSGGWRTGIDATIAYEQKPLYTRGEPIPPVDLDKWLGRDELARVRTQQSEYARLLAEKML